MKMSGLRLLVSISLLFKTLMHCHGSVPADSNVMFATNNGIQGAMQSNNPAINDLISIQKLAQAMPELSRIGQLFNDLGMAFYLEQSRDVTIFMPTNDAFEALDIPIHKLSWETKWKLLQYHIIPNNIRMESITNKGNQYDTWEGSSVNIHKDLNEGAQIYINEALVASDPIESFNGTCFIIDKVLVPPSLTKEELETLPSDQDSDDNVRKPDFLHRINQAHAKWDESTYRNVPLNNMDTTRPHDQIMGFSTGSAEGEHEDPNSDGNVLIGSHVTKESPVDTNTAPRIKQVYVQTPREPLNWANLGFSAVLLPNVLDLTEGLLPFDDVRNIIHSAVNDSSHIIKKYFTSPIQRLQSIIFAIQ